MTTAGAQASAIQKVLGKKKKKREVFAGTAPISKMVVLLIQEN